MTVNKSTLTSPRLYIFLTLILVLAGSFFRFDRFIEPRSLWLDETWLAYDISTRTPGDILLGQNFFSRDYPVAPLGFTFIQKLCVLTFGQQEWAYRIFPFLCSVLSLFVFARLCREWFPDHWASLVGLALFASNETMIHFAAEAKQYSSDVLVCQLILSFGPQIVSRATRRVNAYLFLAATAAFSYVSLIMWLAVLLPLLVSRIRTRDGEAVHRSIVYGVFLLAVFALFHGSAVRQMLANPAIRHGAMRFFPQQPLWNRNNLRWAAEALTGMIRGAGIVTPAFGLALFAAGLLSSLRRNAGKAVVFVLPIVVSFALTLMRVYPFTGRFIIQNIAIVCLFISESLFALRAWPNVLGRRILSAGLAGMLVCPPFYMAVRESTQQHEIEANRPAMEILREKMRPGDTVFTNSEGVDPFVFYASILRGFPPFSALEVFGETPDLFEKGILCSGPMAFRRDRTGFLFSALVEEKITCHRMDTAPADLSGRTWIFLSHCRDDFGRAWKRNICERGNCRDMFTGPGVSLTLFERSEK